MDAIKETGHSYNEIGKLFDEQPKLDWEPLGDMLHIYKGIITAFPDILTIHKVSITNFIVLYESCPISSTLVRLGSSTKKTRMR